MSKGWRNRQRIQRGGSGRGWLTGRRRNRKGSQGGALSRGVLVKTQATGLRSMVASPNEGAMVVRVLTPLWG